MSAVRGLKITPSSPLLLVDTPLWVTRSIQWLHWLAAGICEDGHGLGRAAGAIHAHHTGAEIRRQSVQERVRLFLRLSGEFKQKQKITLQVLERDERFLGTCKFTV